MARRISLWTRLGVAAQLAGAAVMVGVGEWQVARMIPRLSPSEAVAAIALNLVVMGALLAVLALLRLVWERLGRLEDGAA